MPLLHFASCAAFMLGPQVVIYWFSPLSETDTSLSVAHGAVSYICTEALKICFLAVLGSDEPTVRQAILSILLCGIDFLGMWWCLNRLSHRRVSNTEKVVSVGLGWATAETFIRRLIHAYQLGAKEEFTWHTIALGFHSNLAVAHSVGFAMLMARMGDRRVAARGLASVAALCCFVAACMPQLPELLMQHSLLVFPRDLVLDAVTTVLICTLAAIFYCM